MRSSSSTPASCWITRSATTTSPIDSVGSSPPATPEKTTVRQPNRSASSVVTSAALTLPIPEPASTTSCPSIVPVSKTVCAATSLRESARAARKCASSCGSAQISPMVTLQCALPLAVGQCHLVRCSACWGPGSGRLTRRGSRRRLVGVVVELADRRDAVDAGQRRRRGEDPPARQRQQHAGVPHADVLSGLGGEVGELPLVPVACLKEATHYAAALFIGDVHGDRPAQPGGQSLRQGHEAHDDEEVHRGHGDGQHSRPAPAAMPMAADSQTAAAVVSPCTDPRRKMMMPAPRKPMPDTIWAATR